MKIMIQVISYIGLAFTIIPSILFLSGSMELTRVKLIMVIATIVWFASTPFWMEKKSNT